MADTKTAKSARRIGYVIAIAINAALLVVVNNLLEWGWISWLTDDFEKVLPLLNLSLVATMVVNAVYLIYDASWFKSVCELGLLAITMAVLARTYIVFPFDFSAYAGSWETLTRLVIVLGMIGVGIAMVVHLVKLIGLAVTAGSSGPPREKAST